MLQLQAWFLKDDMDRARSLLKSMIHHTPDKAIFALTGSSMCTVWLHVAQTAPNGILMLSYNQRCHLPAAVSRQASVASWAYLQEARSDLPDEIADYIGSSIPAMQVYLSEQYLHRFKSGPSSAELLEFVKDFEINKLQLEVGILLDHMLQ